MTSTIDQGRGILGFLGPLTGARAVGKVMIVPDASQFAPGQTYVPLNPNTWLAPVLAGVLYPQVCYRVLPDYTNKVLDARGNLTSLSGLWNIPKAGALVDVEAHMGGTRYNLGAGTTMRFVDFVPDGFQQVIGGDVTKPAVVVGSGGITGGTVESFYGPDVVNQVAIYESLNSRKMQLDLFRAQLGNAPSIMLTWTGTNSPEFAGRGAARWHENWTLLLFVDRNDDDPARRGQGMRLLDAIVDLTLWRTVYGDDGNTGMGGLIVSADSSLEPRTRTRIMGDDAVFQSLYVYSVGMSSIRVANRFDPRAFSPWRRTRLDVNFPIPQNDSPVLPVVVDNEFLMQQS